MRNKDREKIRIRKKKRRRKSSKTKEKGEEIRLIYTIKKINKLKFLL